MKSNQKETYTNLQDEAKHTTREYLTEKEFNTFLNQTIGTYSNLSDNAKSTIKQVLSTQPLDTIINMSSKGSYVNISDEIKMTLKQILTLQTYNTAIKQNIGTYTNISDEIKTTLKDLLTSLETNHNIKSAHNGTYANLTDLAKGTIKEFIATSELNINMNPNNKKDTAYFTDLAKITHKQNLLNEDYLSHPVASGLNKNPKSQDAERNMRQNTVKEVIAQGRYPTLSGQKQIPTTESYGNIRLNDKPNYNRPNAPTLITNDRQKFDTKIKTGVYYDERLYNELLKQFDENPLVNNVQTTVKR
jgi:hypothetical protein